MSTTTSTTVDPTRWLMASRWYADGMPDSETIARVVLPADAAPSGFAIIGAERNANRDAAYELATATFGEIDFSEILSDRAQAHAALVDVIYRGLEAQAAPARIMRLYDLIKP